MERGGVIARVVAGRPTTKFDTVSNALTVLLKPLITPQQTSAGAVTQRPRKEVDPSAFEGVPYVVARALLVAVARLEALFPHGCAEADDLDARSVRARELAAKVERVAARVDDPLDAFLGERRGEFLFQDEVRALRSSLSTSAPNGADGADGAERVCHELERRAKGDMLDAVVAREAHAALKAELDVFKAAQTEATQSRLAQPAVAAKALEQARAALSRAVAEATSLDAAWLIVRQRTSKSNSTNLWMKLSIALSSCRELRRAGSW